MLLVLSHSSLEPLNLQLCGKLPAAKTRVHVRVHLPAQATDEDMGLDALFYPQYLGGQIVQKPAKFCVQSNIEESLLYVP